MTTPTAYHRWETVSDRVDQSLALVQILRELFCTWEQALTVGTDERTDRVESIDLRVVTDVLTSQLTQASELLETTMFPDHTTSRRSWPCLACSL